MMKARKIHHEARHIGGDEEWAWGVSDCYLPSGTVEMTTEWSRVTCGNCLKVRKPAREPATARPALEPE